MTTAWGGESRLRVSRVSTLSKPCTISGLQHRHSTSANSSSSTFYSTSPRWPAPKNTQRRTESVSGGYRQAPEAGTTISATSVFRMHTRSAVRPFGRSMVSVGKWDWTGTCTISRFGMTWYVDLRGQWVILPPFIPVYFHKKKKRLSIYCLRIWSFIIFCKSALCQLMIVR